MRTVLFSAFVFIASCQAAVDENRTPLNTATCGVTEKKSAGNSTFLSKCASCHHRMKDATGPALGSDLFIGRDKDWLDKFLRDRSQLSKDSALKSRKAKWIIECPEFPELSEAEVENLYDYLK